VAAVVSPAATAEPDYEFNGQLLLGLDC